MASKTIKVGDKVNWRPVWGTMPEQVATIEAIQLCEDRHRKDGIEMNEVFAKDLDRCCVSLTNGSWAYGYQLSARS